MWQTVDYAKAAQSGQNLAMGQMKVDQYRRDRRMGDLVGDSMSSGTYNPTTEQRQEMYKIDPERAMQIESAFAGMDQNQKIKALENAQLMANWAASMSDMIESAPDHQKQAVYERVLQAGSRIGLGVDKAPKEYDPVWFKSQMALAMDYSDVVTNAAKKAGMESQQAFKAGEASKDRGFKAGESAKERAHEKELKQMDIASKERIADTKAQTKGKGGKEFEVKSTDEKTIAGFIASKYGDDVIYHPDTGAIVIKNDDIRKQYRKLTSRASRIFKDADGDITRAEAAQMAIEEDEKAKGTNKQTMSIEQARERSGKFWNQGQ